MSAPAFPPETLKRAKRVKEINQDLPAYEARARAHEADNGRRGEPLPGCDCVHCFGRCSIDRDAAMRDMLSRRQPAGPLSAVLDE